MIYKKYGSKGIDLSAIGCGGMRFSDPEDIDKNASVVKAAYDAGVNYFDTAPGYCADKSEYIFGAAIKEMRKDEQKKPFYIATKSGQSEPAEVRKNLEQSLKRLGVDSIDFYYFWCIITMDAYNDRKSRGVLKEFEKLKSEGLIKNLCISTHLSGDDIEKVLDDYPFDGILLGYSAMNFAYRDAGLNAAAKLGMGVTVMNPLGGGLIPQHPEKFNFIKTRNDETIVEAALRFLINDSRIAVALIGFNNEDEIRQAVRAVDGFKPIPEEKIAQIRSGIRDDFNKLCTSCQYCDLCPEGIPVPKMMDAYNHYMFTGKPVDAINRLRWHWGINPDDDYIRKCTECGKCEQACTQKLPIRKRLKAIRTEADKVVQAGK